MDKVTNTYMIVKHTHLLMIALSVSFFMIRLVGHRLRAGFIQTKTMRVLPHLVDTCLIVSGLTLCVVVHQYPIQSPWLTEKILALLGYIVLAVVSIRSQRSWLFKTVVAVGALSWVVFAATLAVSKQPSVLSSWLL